MGAAKKLKYHHPKFRAVPNEHKSNKNMHVNSHHLKMDPVVLITWTILIAMTVAFWLLVVKLF